jgi:hypothetical protein
LFPVLQGRHADADHASEFRLRLPQPLPDSFDIDGSKMGSATWRRLASPNFPGLPDARRQIVEILFFHENSS